MTDQTTGYESGTQPPSGTCLASSAKPSPERDCGGPALRWRDRIRTWLRDESGTTLVEFSITIPVLLLSFFVVLEYSYLKVREVSLDRATDETFRELRLGLISEPTHDKVKEAICAKGLATVMLRNCESNLLLEVREVPKSDWSINSGAPICLDTTPEEDYEPPIVFSPGAQNQMMIARACLIQEPILPVFEAVLSIRRYDAQGNFALISKSAFVNEPS